MNQFSKALLHWYDECRRELPWRGETDPYRIWLSEIMLQQTRIETVVRYYSRFLDHFPTVYNLANADQDTVLKLWEGLGYYSRARNLHAAAKQVSHEFGGRFPDTAAGLRKLSGVGPYAANAIASIAFGEPVPALDGNQARVISRIFAWDSPLKTPFDLEPNAMILMDSKRPGDYNQALMDLGASVCTPKTPKCTDCPVSAFCKAFKESDPESYPRRKPPVAKQDSDMTVVLAQCGNTLAIRRRPSKGLLGGMYEFPAIEGRLSEAELPAALEALGFRDVICLRPLPPSKHVFTHLVWHMTGWLVSVSEIPDGWIAADNLSAFAFSSAIRVYREIAGELTGD